MLDFIYRIIYAEWNVLGKVISHITVSLLTNNIHYLHKDMNLKNICIYERSNIFIFL